MCVDGESDLRKHEGFIRPGPSTAVVSAEVPEGVTRVDHALRTSQAARQRPIQLHTDTGDAFL